MSRKGCGCGQGATSKDNTPTTSTSAAICIVWETSTNPGHTSKPVKWLADHLVDCIVLFSENKSIPWLEGRALGKMKVEICTVITKVIFKDNSDWAETFRDHPTKFSKGIQDRLGTLKKSYRKQAVKFTQTGNRVRLDAEEAVETEFLWYSNLHSLWRGIPSYTPKVIVDSTPGASRGMQVLALVQPKSAPSVTTASDAPTATPTTSQGVPPPPSVPPSASPLPAPLLSHPPSLSHHVHPSSHHRHPPQWAKTRESSTLSHSHGTMLTLIPLLIIYGFANETTALLMKQP
ncbi:hypothetical protein BDN67DRAFT_984158 [Paxillus ammoniavirescens]|nr:hypothetical protein BDN67DRAFT_984158 [Paxillus ammoniavirescens]